MSDPTKAHHWPPLLGTALLGEVISWNGPRLKVGHLDLIDALRSAGLEASSARELAPRHPFTQACKRLSEARIIQQVHEYDATIPFQFTPDHEYSALCEDDY